MARSPWQLFWRRLRSDRVAIVALGVIVVLVLAALLAPLVVKLAGAPGPNVQDRDATDMFGTPIGPGNGHVFGVDPLGRDVFSRTVYGARVSLLVGIVGTAIAVLVGVTVGLRRRLLPRLGRHAALAPRRRRAVVPRPAARDRDRLRVLARQRLRRGRRHPGRAHGDPRRRARQLDVDRAHRARSGAVAARARVRRRSAGSRGLEPPHRAARDPPEPHGADHRLLKSPASADDLARGGSLVPGRRRSIRRRRAGAG